MAPTSELTDTQQRTDATLDGYINQWKNLPDAQKAGPAGADLKGLIEQVVRERNGDEAWPRVAQALGYGDPSGPQIREGLDSRYPRTDGSATNTNGSSSGGRTQNAASGETPAAVANPGYARPVDAPDGVNTLAFNAPPGDGRVWLPGNEHLPKLSGGDTELLNNRDAAIEAFNTKHFNVDPTLAWHLAGANLPATFTNISTMGATHDLAKKLVENFSAAVNKLNATFNTHADAEPLIAQERDRMKQSLEALKTAAENSLHLHEHISAGAVAANDAFHQMRGENRNQREALAREVIEKPARGNLPGSLRFDGHLALPEVSSDLSRINDVHAAAGDITRVAQGITAPGSVDKQTNYGPTGNRSNSGAGAGAGTGGASAAALPGLDAQAASPSGATATGTPAAPGAGLANGAKSGLDSKDIAGLLSQLANTAAPFAQQAAQIPQQAAQQAAQIPQQLANAAQQAAQTPGQLLNKLRGATPENAKLTAAEQAAAKDAASDRAATQVAFTAPKPAEAAALGTPGSPARPNQLDATGKPVDKDGDGKVDKEATPLSKKTVKPFDLSIPADGKNIQVKGVPDPRVGEMMLNMAQGKGDNPMSVLEAAKASGMDIPALGDPLDPAKAKVGDAVIGDNKSGLYLGDGKVLTSAGQVEEMGDVLGENGFVSEIPLPELPETAEADGKKPDAVTVSSTEPEPAAVKSDAGDSAPATAAENSQAASYVAAPAAPVPPVAPPPPAAPVAPAPEPPAAPPAPPAPAAAPAPPPAPPAEPPAPPAASPASSPAGAPAGGLPKQVPYEGRALG